MTDSEKLAKAEKLLKQVIGNYQVAASIAEHEGYETNYGQDAVLVDYFLGELTQT